MQVSNLIREGARLLMMAAIGLSTGSAIQSPQTTMAKVAVNEPGAPATIVAHTCLIKEIGTFRYNVYLVCETPGPGNIDYFVWPTKGANEDTKGAARFLNVALTAKALGKMVKLGYDDASNLDSVPPDAGCDATHCRQPVLIGIPS